VHSLIRFVFWLFSSWNGRKFLLNLGSVIFGLFGTWLMSRRYARKFWRSFLYSFIVPAAYFFIRARICDYIGTSAGINKDIEDSAIDMTIGVYLLFWAFLLQLIALLIDTFC